MWTESCTLCETTYTKLANGYTHHSRPRPLLLWETVDRDRAADLADGFPACQHIHESCLAGTAAAHQSHQHTGLRKACVWAKKHKNQSRCGANRPNRVASAIAAHDSHKDTGLRKTCVNKQR